MTNGLGGARCDLRLHVRLRAIAVHDDAVLPRSIAEKAAGYRGQAIPAHAHGLNGQREDLCAHVHLNDADEASIVSNVSHDWVTSRQAQKLRN